jgi:hypothetical protein
MNISQRGQSGDDVCLDESLVVIAGIPGIHVAKDFNPKLSNQNDWGSHQLSSATRRPYLVYSLVIPRPIPRPRDSQNLQNHLLGNTEGALMTTRDELSLLNEAIEMALRLTQEYGRRYPRSGW